MKYHELKAPNKLERPLIQLGLFYSALGKPGLAEDLYTQAIVKMEQENQLDYNLVLAKNLLGRLLLKAGDQRKEEGMLHLQ